MDHHRRVAGGLALAGAGFLAMGLGEALADGPDLTAAATLLTGVFVFGILGLARYDRTVIELGDPDSDSDSPVHRYGPTAYLVGGGLIFLAGLVLVVAGLLARFA